jgi:hypothetical protein
MAGTGQRFRDVSGQFRDVSGRFRDVSGRFRDVSKRFRDVSEQFREVSKTDETLTWTKLFFIFFIKEFFYGKQKRLDTPRGRRVQSLRG